jgi:hypothetical protein
MDDHHFGYIKKFEKDKRHEKNYLKFHKVNYVFIYIFY